MLSNEEAFAKADFEACELEKRIGRKLTGEEYSDFVWWYIQNLRYSPEIRPPNPHE